MTIHAPLSIPDGAQALFHCLSEPTRLAILEILSHGEHCVKDLTNETGLAQSTISEHVACLRDCGLISGRSEGRQTLYSLTCPALTSLLNATKEVLDHVHHTTCPRCAQ